MNNPWKLATLALVLTAVTAVSTGVTTAYMLRAPMSLAPAAPVATASFAPSTAPAPAPVVRPGVVTQRAPVVRHAVVTQPVATAPVLTDCASGGDRAMKIAKPGLIGTLGGAALGAIGGAIADGGKGAGKGALIGGIAGAAAGTGYGAYKTKQECGTIFGNTTLAGF